MIPCRLGRICFRLLAVLPVAIALSHSPRACAAVVTFVGNQLNLGPGWRTSGVSKPLDIDGDNILGTDGYNVVNLQPVSPDYVSATAILTTTYSGNSSYASIDDPTTPSPTDAFLTGTMNPAPGTGVSANLFSFTLNANAVGRVIRVGLLVDNLDDPAFNAASLTLVQTSGTGATSGPVATVSAAFNNQIPDWIFFDISGAVAGDSFVIRGMGGAATTATLGGVAFDSVGFAFTNNQALSIPSTGPASQYPSTITINNLPTSTLKVSVTLSNLSHTFPDDLVILLVSPTGQKAMVMAHAGGGSVVANAMLTFDDQAPGPPPDNTPILSGTYQPVSYAPTATLPSPAPAGPYATALSTFNGLNPNGVWSLYVYDDSAGYTGTLQGWSLKILSGTTPTATTLSASGISGGNTFLNASVKTSGSPALVRFLWGTTTNYGNTTSGILLPPGNSAVTVTDSANLTPGVIYHYRARVYNAYGLTDSADAIFWAPYLALNGANPLTNECHVAFAEPGATASAPPVAFSGGSFHSLALRADGSVAAWGDNTYSQSSPPGANDVIAIAAGSYHSLALRSNRTVLAWGRNNNLQCNVPSDATNIISIGGGLQHSVAARGDGSVLAWGNSTYNQTVIPANATNVIAVDAGEYHNVALRANRTVVAWGGGTINNPSDFIDYGQAIVPANATNVIAISAGAYHCMALRGDGSVVAWGAGTTVNPGDLASYGQCIIPANATNVIAIAAGGQHSLALRADGTIVGWGRSDQGQLTFPAAATNIVSIAAGFNWSFAIRADGEFFQSGLPSGYDRSSFPATVTNQTITINRTGTLDVNSPGTYTLTYATTNALGGYAIGTRTVVVADRTPPVITLTGANPLYWTIGVPFVEPGATANDACEGNVGSSIAVTGTVNISTVGTNTLTYKASDSTGNIQTTNRTVIVTSTPSLSGFAAQVSGTNGITGARTVLLSANVNPNGLAGAAWFQYGLNTTYPGTTSASNFVASFAAQPRSATISNLLVGMTYHYRAVATNSLGTTTGPDQIFSIPTGFAAGDLNGDGIVDQSELNAVYGNYVTNSQWLLMTNVAGLGGTNVTFTLSNSPLGNFSVEYSTDLINWSPLGSAAPFYLFTDTNAPASPQRSYRLRYP